MDNIIEVHPEIVSHNIETVERLTREVRVQAKYERSMFVLQYLKEQGMKTKSGLMCGMGETEEEVIQTMKDLRAVGVDIITLGQYMRPSLAHLPVEKYWTPREFSELQTIAYDLGFNHVRSGPLVRSSYHAGS